MVLKDFIKKKVVEKGYSSLYAFCIYHRIDYHKLWETLEHLRTSRPLILRVAELLEAPEIMFMYERELQAMRRPRPKNKGGVP